MHRDNVKAIIQSLFFQYYMANNTQQDTEVVAVAQGYWGTRLETEIERDTKAGVTCEDYIKWCLSERDECFEVIGLY